MSEQTISIAGRKFRALTETTLAHDVYVCELIVRAGLATLTMTIGETSEEFARRTLDTLAANGAVFDLLGALMIPEENKPLDWTPDIAAETAQFLRKLTAPEDKRVVRSQIGAILAGFCRAGLTVLRITRSSFRTHAQA